MIITEIQAEGFRNLQGKLCSAAGINILCGDNAQGKTNWLEAIYALGNTKSFRTAITRELIRIDHKEPCHQALLRGHIEREHLAKDLQLQIEENSKNYYVNGKRETVIRYMSNLDVVVFCGEQMQVIRGEPAERRRFLDQGIVSLSPTYLKVISEYNRVLKQKNTLLKEVQEHERKNQHIDLIHSWNEQLIEHGTRIHTARREYTTRLSQVLSKQLFSEKVLSINYRSALAQHGEIETAEQYRRLFHQRLQLRLENEIMAGHALIGPHRDELDIFIDGLEVSKFGSSGEQRSALLTLDLAQLSVYNVAFEEYPIFLIDDIDAELDARRISLLLDHLEGKMQVFISTSKREIAAKYQTKATCHFIYQGTVVLPSSLLSVTETLNTFVDDNEIKLLSTPPATEDSTLTNLTAPILTPTASLPNISVTNEPFGENDEDKHRAPF
jgi:DNA replication and repair protein RecF